MANTPIRQRVEWIDCAKGIAMLLVLLGHRIFGFLRGAIFSFHMPLFFIFSTMTFRMSTDMGQWWKKTKKSFLHLVVPALIVITVFTTGKLLSKGGTIWNLGFWKGMGLSLLFSSGSEFYIGSVHIPRMGMPWFLIVLFTGRSLFDLLHLKLGKAFVPVCIGLSVAGVLIGNKVWLPFSFDVTMASLFFLLVGYGLRNYDPAKKSVSGLLVVTSVWALTLLVTTMMDAKYLEMSIRRYPLYPLCLVTAVAGTLMIARVSSLIVRYLKWLKPALAFIGENSLMLLCVHTPVFMWEWEGLYGPISSNTVIRIGVLMGIELTVFLVIVSIKKFVKRRACK